MQLRFQGTSLLRHTLPLAPGAQGESSDRTPGSSCTVQSPRRIASPGKAAPQHNGGWLGKLGRDPGRVSPPSNLPPTVRERRDRENNRNGPRDKLDSIPRLAQNAFRQPANPDRM